MILAELFLLDEWQAADWLIADFAAGSPEARSVYAEFAMRRQQLDDETLEKWLMAHTIAGHALW